MLACTVNQTPWTWGKLQIETKYLPVNVIAVHVLALNRSISHVYEKKEKHTNCCYTSHFFTENPLRYSGAEMMTCLSLTRKRKEIIVERILEVRIHSDVLHVFRMVFACTDMSVWFACAAVQSHFAVCNWFHL